MPQLKTEIHQDMKTLMREVFFNASSVAVHMDTVPMFLFFTEEKEFIVMPITPEMPKETIKEAVKQTAVNLNAKAVVYLDEAWMLKVNKNQKYNPEKDGPIKNHPDRVKNLLVAIRDNHNNTFMITGEITNREGGVRIVGEPTETKEGVVNIIPRWNENFEA